MSRTVTLDGVDYTNHSSALDEFTLSFELDDTRSLNYSFAEGIIFFGPAFDYLESQLVTDADYLKNTVQAVLTVDERAYSFSITVGQIDYRPGLCEIEAVLIRETPQARAYRQLKNTIIYRDGFNRFLRVPYCEDPTTLQAVFFLAVYSLFLPILAILQAIENLFGGDLPSARDVEAAISGCHGRYHTPPLLKDVLDYHLPRAGLTLESSILNAPPYSRTFLLQALEEGCEDCERTEAARLNLNVIQALEQVKQLHNAEFRIQGERLVYERRDHFEQSQLTLIDVDQAWTEERSEAPPTYTPVEDSLCAYTRLEFTRDALDTAGNRTMRHYREIIEHNPEGNHPALSGECTKILPFGSVRGQEDRDSSRFINRFRERLGYQDALILKNGTCEQIKPVVWDGSSPRHDVRMVRRDIGNNRKEYNHPYFLTEGEALINDFHAADFPDTASLKRWEIADFTYLPADFCATADLVEQYGTDIGIQTRFGTGKAQRIHLNFDNRTVRLEGVQV